MITEREETTMHLSAMDFAVLLESVGKDAANPGSREHLNSCPECWRQWITCLAAFSRERGEARRELEVIELRPLYDDVPQLAAADGPAGEAGLPLLRSTDDRVILELRRAKDGSIIGALTALHVSPSAVVLAVPSRGLAFAFDEQGRVQLPGVTAEDLRSARLEIHLETLDPGS